MAKRPASSELKATTPPLPGAGVAILNTRRPGAVTRRLARAKEEEENLDDPDEEDLQEFAEDDAESDRDDEEDKEEDANSEDVIEEVDLSELL